MKVPFLKPFLFAAAVLTAFTGCILGGNDVENMIVPRLMIEERGVEYGSLRGLRVTMPLSKSEIQVLKEPVVGEFEIVNIDLVKFDMGLGVQIHVTERGARALYRASVTHRGERLVLLANEKAVGARRIDGDINDGRFYMFLEMPDEELEQFVIDMRASIVELQSQYHY